MILFISIWVKSLFFKGLGYLLFDVYLFFKYFKDKGIRYFKNNRFCFVWKYNMFLFWCKRIVCYYSVFEEKINYICKCFLVN